MEARIRRHYEALSAGRWPALALQVVHVPVFHGLTFSIAMDLERPVEISALEEALGGEHVDLVLEDTDSPSNLAATGQNDVLVRMRPELTTRNASRDFAAVAVGGGGQSAAACAECGGVRAGFAAAAAAGDGAVRRTSGSKTIDAYILPWKLYLTYFSIVLLVIRCKPWSRSTQP